MAEYKGEDKARLCQASNCKKILFCDMTWYCALPKGEENHKKLQNIQFCSKWIEPLTQITRAFQNAYEDNFIITE